MEQAPQERAADTRHLRVIALVSVVVLALLLPLAAASAGSLFDDAPYAGEPDRRTGAARETGREQRPTRDSGARTGVPADGRSPSAPKTAEDLLPGLGLSPAAGDDLPRVVAGCGPELSSPDGVEAQTCVLRRDGEIWARTYYRNTTGEDLDAVLSFMGPAARTVQMHCAVSARDEPGVCETPRERTAGTAREYTAVAEFAGAGGRGPLLLRSGSNPAPR